MMMLKTFVSSFVLLLASSQLVFVPCQAQKRGGVASEDTVTTPVTSKDAPIRGVQYASAEEAAAALAAQKRLPLIAGVSVSTDVCGMIMAACTPYGQYEAAARLNMRGRYFPVVEVGMGVSNHTNESTDLHYKVHSPYYRVGLDYNVAKNARAQGRIMVGVRYAFTTYKYDVDGPDRVDPVYGTSMPFVYKGIRGTNHWAEVVLGLEARVWSVLHLGWSVRYRMRIYNRRTAVDNAWYVPGYGKNDTHALGGTFNVIIDI
jgi:hypothetical protein|uniref:DUF6048 family protein n=2 Tax=Alloprevotella sp. TaxID=1872471 RepID=UPI003FD808BC